MEVKYVLKIQTEIIFEEKFIKKICILHETKTIIWPEYLPNFL
jgi:hypothetical protein